MSGAQAVSGILNIYKEPGYTSHDVVAKLRRILGEKKIGHTGTLDPAAAGVLPVCIGKATRVCSLLTEERKTYRAVMLLGRTTDTQDTTGKTLEERTAEVTDDEVRAAVRSFQGSYAQIPPMYSAVRMDGRHLYELAREGKTVERTPRDVQIFDITVEAVDLPRVTMTVTCSKGTYIRTLCQDIGERLGCGACMEALLRTRVGPFCVEDSLRLSRVEALNEEGRLFKVLFPVDALFLQYPAARATGTGEKKLKNGNPLLPDEVQETAEENAHALSNAKPCRLRLYDEMGIFCAIYEYRPQKHAFWPVKVFL